MNLAHIPQLTPSARHRKVNSKVVDDTTNENVLTAAGFQGGNINLF